VLGAPVEGLHDAIRPYDAAVIAAPVDFVGLTYYSPAIIRSGGPVQRCPVAANGWQQLHPQGLHGRRRRGSHQGRCRGSVNWARSFTTLVAARERAGPD
jgi:hypothetical protein